MHMVTGARSLLSVPVSSCCQRAGCLGRGQCQLLSPARSESLVLAGSSATGQVPEGCCRLCGVEGSASASRRWGWRWGSGGRALFLRAGMGQFSLQVSFLQLLDFFIEI